MMRFDARHIGFGLKSRQEDYAQVGFAERVITASCLLTGFDIGYAASGGDHHLGYMHMRLHAELLDPRRARVTGDLGLGDRFGWWDNPYQEPSTSPWWVSDVHRRCRFSFPVNKAFGRAKVTQHIRYDTRVISAFALLRGSGACFGFCNGAHREPSRHIWTPNQVRRTPARCMSP